MTLISLSTIVRVSSLGGNTGSAPLEALPRREKPPLPLELAAAASSLFRRSSVPGVATSWEAGVLVVVLLQGEVMEVALDKDPTSFT